MNPYQLSKGTNKLFIGELLTCISSVFSFSTVIISILFMSNANESNFVLMSTVLTMIGLSVILMSFIGFILCILGVRQLSSENNNVKKALYCYVAMIVASAIASFFSDQQVNLILNEVPQVLNIAVTIYLLKGLSEILRDIKESELEKTVKKAIPIVLAIFGVVCAFDLLIQIIESSNTVMILAVGVIIIELIGYYIELNILLKAKRLFKDMMMDYD